MTKVLLVYVNSFMDNLIPIGISLLSAYLKKAGHTVKLFDTTFYRTSDKTGDAFRVENLQIKETNLSEYGIHPKENMIGDFQKIISSFEPDIIGLSVVESTHYIMIKLLDALDDYQGSVIVGGIHATMCPDLILDQKNVDFVCIGEGEGAIVDFANRIEKKEDMSGIPNIYQKKNGKIEITPARTLVHMDDLISQDWSIYEKERFYKPMGGKVWISGSIELQRGCIFMCSFCCNAKLKENFGKGYVRQKSMEKFINEVKEKQKEYGINYLYLVAENFLSMKDEEFDKFIDMYSSVKLPFWIESRPEDVTEKKLTQMKEVGCEGISIGVEHGNDAFRRKMLNRFVSNDAIINAFKIAKKSKIRVCANNIIGFPEETRELVFDTIELNKKLQPDNIIVNIFCPYRGTKLFDVCVQKGYIDKNHIAGDYRGINAGLDMFQLTREEIIGLQRTFPLYVRFPKDFYPRIKSAETNNKEFKDLSYMFSVREGAIDKWAKTADESS